MFENDIFDLGYFVFMDSFEDEENENDTSRSTESRTIWKENEPHQKEKED